MVEDTTSTNPEVMIITEHCGGWDRHNINHGRVGYGRDYKQSRGDDEGPRRTSRCCGEEQHGGRVPSAKITLLGCSCEGDIQIAPSTPSSSPPASETVLYCRWVHHSKRFQGPPACLGNAQDPRLWEDSSKFKPKRFLNCNGERDYSGNNFQYLPFGSGRRICAGLPLVERTLMYVLASLLHSFQWKLPASEELDLSERFGLVIKKKTPLIVIPSPILSNMDVYK